MSTKITNTTTNKHIIKNMMKDMCMHVHQEYCG